MNKHYNQLGKILLEETKKTKKTREPQAPRRKVTGNPPPELTPAQKAELGELASRRGKEGTVNSWTVYSHMGKLIAEKAEKLDIVQVASRKAADVEAQKRTNTGTPKEQATARREARRRAVTPGGVRTHLARKIPGVKHSTDKPIISMKK